MQDLECVEVFSGVASVVRGFRAWADHYDACAIHDFLQITAVIFGGEEHSPAWLRSPWSKSACYLVITAALDLDSHACMHACILMYTYVQ